MGNKHSSKDGQAMIELSVGMVVILILMLGMSQIAEIVSYDFESILNARMDVAEDLINSTTQEALSLYNPTLNFMELNNNINLNAQKTYADYESEFPQQERQNQFEYLSNGENPLTSMAGASKGTSIEIESTIMQDALERSSIQLNHESWLPAWDGL